MRFSYFTTDQVFELVFNGVFPAFWRKNIIRIHYSSMDYKGYWDTDLWRKTRTPQKRKMASNNVSKVETFRFPPVVQQLVKVAPYCRRNVGVTSPEWNVFLFICILCWTLLCSCFTSPLNLRCVYWEMTFNPVFCLSFANHCFYSVVRMTSTMCSKEFGPCTLSLIH